MYERICQYGQGIAQEDVGVDDIPSASFRESFVDGHESIDLHPRGAEEPDSLEGVEAYADHIATAPAHRALPVAEGIVHQDHIIIRQGIVFLPDPTARGKIDQRLPLSQPVLQFTSQSCFFFFSHDIYNLRVDLSLPVLSF